MHVTSIVVICAQYLRKGLLLGNNAVFLVLKLGIWFHASMVVRKCEKNMCMPWLLLVFDEITRSRWLLRNCCTLSKGNRCRVVKLRFVKRLSSSFIQWWHQVYPNVSHFLILSHAIYNQGVITLYFSGHYSLQCMIGWCDTTVIHTSWSYSSNVCEGELMACTQL